MGTVGTMASITLVFLILMAHHTCQCKGSEDRFEETAGIERENARMEAFEDQMNQLSSQFEMREAEMRESLEAEMKEWMAAQEAEMKETLAAEMKESLAAEEAEMNKKLAAEVAAVRKEVDHLQAVPALIQCAYQNYLGESGTHKFITFDRLISDYSNNVGSLDVQTGRFEAAVSGYYTVTHSAIATFYVNQGGKAHLQLWQNGVPLGDEGLSSFELGSGLEGSATYFHGQSSCTVILRMEAGSVDQGRPPETPRRSSEDPERDQWTSVTHKRQSPKTANVPTTTVRRIPASHS